MLAVVLPKMLAMFEEFGATRRIVSRATRAHVPPHGQSSYWWVVVPALLCLIFFFVVGIARLKIV